jgi:hypothetical protein
MPITCMLTPAEARSLFKLLKPRMIFFFMTFLFRT